jgi:release factor glutamine methyltransferase
VQREVREWEPHAALFGGTDGLVFYRRLIAEAPTYLKRGGCLVFEIGYSQLDAVRQMIEASVLELIEVTNDLQGIPRTLTSRKS